MQLIGHTRPILYNLIHANAAVAEVYLTLWEQSSDRTPLAEPRQAGDTLRRFAKVFPIGQPRAWLWQGKHEQLSGNLIGAQAAWQSSLTAAEKLHMPYEQGLAHFALGRHGARAERQKQLA